MDQQQPTAPTRYKDTPTLRVGDMVEFDSGMYAGVCGKICWLSLVTGRVAVTTQNGDVRTGRVDEVSRI